jgi:hypothetical protein
MRGVRSNCGMYLFGQVKACVPWPMIVDFELEDAVHIGYLESRGKSALED